MVARLYVTLATTLLTTTITTVPTVRAAPAKFTHDRPAAVEVTVTERSKPLPKHTDETPKPKLGSDEALELEALLGEIHTEQIAALEDLIKRTPMSEPMERADLMFRLGEIHAKQHRLFRLTATKAEIELVRADAKAKPALVKKAAENAELAKQARLGAVKVYDALTRDPIYQPYPRMDIALFYYGYTLQGGGYLKEARATYDKLLKDYPKSRYVPESHLAFADYFYDTNRLADAEARYKRVLEFPKSSVYWYATYKLGWVAFNLGKFEDSLETFYQVTQGTKTDPARAQLHHAARQDFVRAYAEIGRADKALVAFRRIDAAKAAQMLEMLGDLYVGQGQAEKAIYVYRQLIAEQPTSASVCVWQHHVARAMLTVGSTADRVHEIEQLGKLWIHVRDRKTLPKPSSEECRDAAADMTGQLARMFHQEAAKTKQAETFGFADRLYRAYLAGFPTAPDAADTRYFRAELLWARAELTPSERNEKTDKTARLVTQQWSDAADAFAIAVEGGGLDKPRVQIAADAAMLARMKALNVDPRVRPVALSDDDYKTVPKPRPIPEMEQRLLTAYDGYLKHVQDQADSERVDVMFHKANLLRRFDHLPEALAIFEAILAKHRRHETAEFAAQLALDGYNRLHQYDAMLALADRLAADASFMTGKTALQDTVATLRRQAMRKAAEALEATGKATHNLAAFVECGQKLVEVYNMAAMAPDGEELLYNAAVCFEQGRSMGAAALLYKQLATLFPKGKLTARSLARLGNVYAQTAFYREAAEKFEEYAAKYAGEQDAYDLLSDAVMFRKGMGDDTKAIDDTKTFVRMFGAKRPIEAATAFWSLGAIYEKQTDVDQLVRHYRAYLAKYGDTGGPDRAVIAWTKIGQALWQRACPVKLVDGSCVRVVREVAANGTGLGAAIPKQCDDDSKLKVTVVPRDERDARAAMAAFDRAIALSTGGKGSRGSERESNNVTGDVRGARYHLGLARLGRADQTYERYLGLPIPATLDFDRRKPAIAARSKQRFDAWFTGKRELATTLRGQYEAVIALGDGATAITSAARLGQISQGFSGQLFRAEIPADLRSGPFAEDTTTIYCDTLTALAEPLETDALRSYQACLVTSTKLGWFSEWSRLCERELGQLQPDKWPTVAELRPAPEQVSMIRDVEPPRLTPE